MVGGKGDDDSYSPDVFSNGQRIKRAESRFSASYGDEPGTGPGVKSGTVGDVVEPVTYSTIARANGVPIQRHTDTCTLNNGNCPGECTHVQSTETTLAPDGRDEQDKAWYARAWDGTKEEAGKFWDGLYDNSSTVRDGHSILDRVGDYFGDPSLIGDDVKGAYESLPSPSEAWEWTKDVGAGIRDGAVDVWNDPAGAAEGAKDWAVDPATGIKDDVAEAYDEGGISAAAGAVIGKIGDVVSPSTKARAAKAGAEGLDAIGDARRRRNDDEPDEENGDDGARSTRRLSLREQYLGRTPGKNSRTGREVRERMREEGILRTNRRGQDEFLDENGVWRPVDSPQTHMGHHPMDAVDYWNSTGRHHGAKSAEVRQWMLASDNYRLEWGPLNSARGGAATSRYQPPAN